MPSLITNFSQSYANRFLDLYFRSESVGSLVNHILSLYAGKVAAYSRDDKRLEIRLDREAEGRHSISLITLG